MDRLDCHQHYLHFTPFEIQTNVGLSVGKKKKKNTFLSWWNHFLLNYFLQFEPKKLLLNSKLIVIYSKFNGNFHNHNHVKKYAVENVRLVVCAIFFIKNLNKTFV